MIKLDVKDRKILYYLSQDSRTPISQLSKKVKLSKNTVNYRIDRLKKDGIIKNFAAVVNLGALNLSTFTLLLKFNEDIYEKPEIIEYFKNHELADWVITLSGQWDIFVEFSTTDLHHLKKIIEEITEHFSGIINTYKLFYSGITLRVEHLIRELYSDLKLEEPIIKKRTIEKYKIDETDKKILEILNQDSSLHYLKIAKKINSTLDIVRYRIKNLIKKGILVKFFPEIDLKKLGYTEYLYTIKLKNITKEKLSSLKNQIKMNPNITYAFFDLTSFNLLFVCAFKSTDKIDHLSRSLRKEFSNIIDQQEYLIIKEQISFNLFPRGISKST